MFIARFSDLLDVEIMCDGCGASLTGRRYRCLQCSDLDLCCTCFMLGVKPNDDLNSESELENHKDEHEFIDLMFKCDCCEAFIVGTRIHCKECEDFDLCLGCFEKAVKFPGKHKSTHAISRHPLVKLRNNSQTECIIQAYIHQHVWLLFASFTLTLTGVLYSDSGTMDPEYLQIVTTMQANCFNLLINSLQQSTSESNDASAYHHQVSPNVSLHIYLHLI